MIALKPAHRIAAGVAIVAFLWIVSGLIFSGDDDNAMDKAEHDLPNVRTVVSVANNHQNSLVLFGRTEAARRVVLKAETSGHIAEIVLEKGQAVKAGQIIARISMDDRKARLVEAEAKVEQYLLAYKAAQQLSKKQYRSRVKLAESKAQLETAKVGLKAIRLDIEHTEIRAPFDAVLNDVLVEVGDFVAVGSAVSDVVELDPIVIAAEVSELVAGKLRVGAGAVITPVGGEAVAGSISYVSKVARESTRTFRIEVSLANPDGTFAVGQTTELRLELGGVQAHLITPAILTLSDEGVLGVKSVDDNATVHFNPVTIIDDTTQGMWVGGLGDHITLITVGQEFVR
ncbi:MAG: efflux RND transporter periplasmic adaptor subunit, partial [Rhodospirillaceae bacterium]|nr:efflux RND transporter periplasmic adaptor subunit [Rhodospirillaceae bacterium]